MSVRSRRMATAPRKRGPPRRRPCVGRRPALRAPLGGEPRLTPALRGQEMPQPLLCARQLATALGQHRLEFATVSRRRLQLRRGRPGIIGQPGAQPRQFGALRAQAATVAASPAAARSTTSRAAAASLRLALPSTMATGSGVPATYIRTRRRSRSARVRPSPRSVARVRPRFSAMRSRMASRRSSAALCAAAAAPACASAAASRSCSSATAWRCASTAAGADPATAGSSARATAATSAASGGWRRCDMGRAGEFPIARRHARRAAESATAGGISPYRCSDGSGQSLAGSGPCPSRKRRQSVRRPSLNAMSPSLGSGPWRWLMMCASPDPRID